MASSDAATSVHVDREGTATRERIVAAATPMFVGRGFDAVPMSKVAKAAGVSTPTVYWHFKSKADLYFEVIERSYVSFFEEVVENTVGETAKDRLHSYVRSFVDAQLRETDATMLFSLNQLIARLPEQRQKEFAVLQRPYAELLGQILQEGRDAGEFEFEDRNVTARAIHTMCEYSAVWFRENRRLSADEVAALHAELAVRMVSAGSGGESRA